MKTQWQVTTTSAGTFALGEPQHSHGFAFNTICLGSQLRQDQISSLAELYGKHFNMRVIPMTSEYVKMINPDNHFGLLIGNNRSTAFAVVYGEKSIEGFISRSCTITSSSISFDDAKRFLQTNFNVSRPRETRQASSQIALYMADLVGFGDEKVGFSVQSESTSGFTAISIMTVPR
jgi:hypothetical protein